MREYRQVLEFANLDRLDIAYVVAKADGSAEVRIGKRGTTGNLEHFTSLGDALTAAQIRCDDKVNGLTEVQVHLEDGAIWDTRYGTLAPRD